MRPVERNPHTHASWWWWWWFYGWWEWISAVLRVCFFFLFLHWFLRWLHSNRAEVFGGGMNRIIIIRNRYAIWCVVLPVNGNSVNGDLLERREREREGRIWRPAEWVNSEREWSNICIYKSIHTLMEFWSIHDWGKRDRGQLRRRWIYTLFSSLSLSSLRMKISLEEKKEEAAPLIKQLPHLNVRCVAAFHRAKFAVIQIDLQHRNCLLSCRSADVHSEGSLRRSNGRKCLIFAIAAVSVGVVQSGRRRRNKRIRLDGNVSKCWVKKKAEKEK